MIAAHNKTFARAVEQKFYIQNKKSRGRESLCPKTNDEARVQSDLQLASHAPSEHA